MPYCVGFYGFQLNVKDGNCTFMGSIFSIFKKGLEKSATKVTRAISGLFTGTRSYKTSDFEELEMMLISADFGIKAATAIVRDLKEQYDTLQKMFAQNQAFVDSLKISLKDINGNETELKEILPNADVLVFGGCEAEWFGYISELSLIQTVGDMEFAEELSQWAVQHDKTVRVHIKADTGMGRIGIETLKDAEKIMLERFGKDSVIALATTVDDKPYVRNVNAFYDDGAFYVLTDGVLLSHGTRYEIDFTK